MKTNTDIDKATRKWAVVDDEEVVFEVLQAMLLAVTPREVVGFTDPIAALAAIRSEPDAFEMLIVDRQMPRMGGVDLLVLAREAAPDLRFVMVTGNTLNLEKELNRLGLPPSFINKPFDVKKLVNAVARAGSLEPRLDQPGEQNPGPGRSISEPNSVPDASGKFLQLAVMALNCLVAA
jgi:DNA-binding NtrC family response regulator